MRMWQWASCPLARLATRLLGWKLRAQGPPIPAQLLPVLLCCRFTATGHNCKAASPNQQTLVRNGHAVERQRDRSCAHRGSHGQGNAPQTSAQANAQASEKI